MSCTSVEVMWVVIVLSILSFGVRIFALAASLLSTFSQDTHTSVVPMLSQWLCDSMPGNGRLHHTVSSVNTGVECMAGLGICILHNTKSR